MKAVQTVVPLICLLALASGAQTRPNDGPPAAEPAPAAMIPGSLRREGSYLLQVKGTLHRDEGTGWWTFRISRDDPRRGLENLTLLPCTLLANLEHLVASMPQEEVVFDLTGQVFVYRDRNFLLPTHAPRLVDYVPPPRARGRDDGEAADDSSETILRNLQETVGPVLRSPRAGEASDSTSPKLLPPGTVILWRRGWMVREESGAWSFVFEADANGLADPPMILLPCLLLERMELFAERTTEVAVLLVSGRVYRYRGRNYLLPTSFQVPRNDTPLRP